MYKPEQEGRSGNKLRVSSGLAGGTSKSRSQDLVANRNMRPCYLVKPARPASLSQAPQWDCRLSSAKVLGIPRPEQGRGRLL